MAGMTVSDQFAWNTPWKNSFQKTTPPNQFDLLTFNPNPKPMIGHIVVWNLISSQYLYDNATGSGLDLRTQPVVTC